MCPCIIHDSSCDSGPAISLLHFKTVFPITRREKKKKSLLNVLLTFQPVDVPSFFILSVFPNLCWHILKQQKKRQSGVLVDFSILFFLKHYFPKTRQSFFLSITKKKLYVY